MSALTAAAAPTVTTFLRARTARTWVQPALPQRSPHRPCERILAIANGKGTGAVTTCEPSERLKDEPRNVSEKIDAIRAKLKSISDGNINVSAYDTAWVALVKRLDGGGGPQFPTSIDWITKNQLPDGSWGDDTFFMVHDRIINTLACIVALKSWNIHHYQCQRGLSFIHGNLWRLTEEDAEWMPVGFEITLPTLLEMAKDLGLDLPYDEPALQEIYSRRELKLSKIPIDALHAGPTTLLLSIEGMPGLDWERLLTLQCPDGSFMSSPAPTAYALMQTGDRKCLQFLEEIVDNFKEGVPFTYPVDIFERLWVVDRLERLGISRYFTSEIQECLDYVYRHLTQKGLAATRDCPVNDIDDTAMGFRLLRLHGYYVSPSMFKHFEKDGEFVCYHGQTNKSITAMYNTYRAAQVSFPGESELERADVYCRGFLEEKRASGNFGDKWVIPKDLAGEVGYALDFPWRASLPRIEARMYLEQYGGSADVWIGKVLYRMLLVSNELFLETAREDFRSFQKLCRLEWNGLRKWYDRNKLAAFGVEPKCVLRAYFQAAASIFEPDRAAERLAWARTAVIAEAVSLHLRRKASDVSTRVHGAISELENHGRDALTRVNEDPKKALLGAIGELIDQSSSENASHCLREAWKQWLRSWTAKEGFESCGGNTALLIVRTVEIASGRYSLKEHDVNRSEYTQLERLTSSICSKLTSRVPVQNGGLKKSENSVSQVDLEMKELAQSVLQSCDSIDRVTRQTFLHVAKSYYYASYCSTETIDSHISKVLFEDVVSE
ncbi:hypothetical protein SEVIR_2G150600v4 [Setaria viridis]|uniref:Terpene synthase TPS8 n=1 Tax=Setaria viridis TaxID=4556 RepID=A0A4U6VTC1_SETVI|nr:ent-copalyl diphosphate synthase 2-like isoform X2 [Setaria viridis]QJA42375.1 terpene synthase TPS8 [Setaria viridis]TKW32144.1 hypothetical protein SEVIR_2G150600v2 [Setaria viridis]